MERRVVVRRLGLIQYQETLQAMQRFTAQRAPDSADEVWLLQHPAVYTQGYSCTQVPLNPTTIPLVKTDRGGQLTYHGPGQIIIYLLFDLKRRKLGIRHIVHTIEAAIVAVLARCGVEGKVRPDAPGVYVQGNKIASLGLRIHRGCSYHGLSLNVNMDLSPFKNIEVCGIQGLDVVSLRKLGVKHDIQVIEDYCIHELSQKLGCEWRTEPIHESLKNL